MKIKSNLTVKACVCIHQPVNPLYITLGMVELITPRTPLYSLQYDLPPIHDNLHIALPYLTLIGYLLYPSLPC